MDIVFSDPGPDPNADYAFAAALRSNGRVILGVDYNRAVEENERLLDGGMAVVKEPMHKGVDISVCAL